MNLVAILGSANSSGQTARITRLCLERLGGDLIDLNQYSISPWDYGHRNRDDGFLGIARQMAAADGIIFATPVYWYSMSAQLKIFYDRLSDLVSGHPLVAANKVLGRSLAGRHTWLIATGSDADPPPGFEGPFRLTSQYFGMRYGGIFYSSGKAASRLSPEEAKGEEEDRMGVFSAGIRAALREKPARERQ